MRGLWKLAAACLLALVFAAWPAYAGAPSPDNQVGRDISGVVPVHGFASKTASSGGNLVYHNGGSVMHTNTTYAVYWIPSGYSVSSGYESIINGFLQNVAADSGKTSNVYYSDTQYYDNTTGNIAYSSSYAGAIVDTNAYPANGCSDSYTSVCLSDAQIQSELDRVITANNLPRGIGTLYFMFTPKNVGSCYSSSSCAFSSYCAYHSHFGSGSSVVLYANQPYANFVPAACGSGQHPNNDDADDTINVASHEHNEAITDGLGNAWYDRRGYENGDKCAWNFGGSLGNTGTGAYNQAIGTGKYYLQQEWSNFSSGCVLTGK